MLPVQTIAKEEGNAVDRTLTRFQGSMLVLAAGTTFSFGPLTFRALLEADAWQYLFYRSFSAAVVAQAAETQTRLERFTGRPGRPPSA